LYFMQHAWVKPGFFISNGGYIGSTGYVPVRYLSPAIIHKPRVAKDPDFRGYNDEWIAAHP